MFCKLSKRLAEDTNGSSLVEFTMVFPVVILAAMGTVDAAWMLFEWQEANKAAYAGARTAAVRSQPIATGIDVPAYNPERIGDSCFDPDTGVADGDVNCPTISTECIPNVGAGGTCTGGFVFNDVAFSAIDRDAGILASMQTVFPRLQRQNVKIAYQTNGLGFAGRPGGLPMTVTVSIRCMTHQFYFLSGLMSWVYTAPGGCDPAPAAAPSIPAFATSLPTEAMGCLTVPKTC